MRVSEYYDIPIYSDKARYVGKVQDVVLDLDEGEILGLGLGREGEEVSMIPYESIMAIGDIILVRSREKLPEPEPEEEAEI